MVVRYDFGDESPIKCGLCVDHFCSETHSSSATGADEAGKFDSEAPARNHANFCMSVGEAGFV